MNSRRFTDKFYSVLVPVLFFGIGIVFALGLLLEAAQ